MCVREGGREGGREYCKHHTHHLSAYQPGPLPLLHVPSTVQETGGYYHIDVCQIFPSSTKFFRLWKPRFLVFLIHSAITNMYIHVETKHCQMKEKCNVYSEDPWSHNSLFLGVYWVSSNLHLFAYSRRIARADWPSAKILRQV